MSDTTSSVAVVAAVVGSDSWSAVGMWGVADESQREFLAGDWLSALEGGLTWDEYVSDLNAWGCDANGKMGGVEQLASYLDEMGYVSPEQVSQLDAAVAANLNDNAPGVPVVEAAAAAEEQTAEDEAAARVAADKLLKGCYRAYLRGEKAYRAGLLEAGKLGHEYVVARMQLHDRRHVAVDTMRLELQRCSSGKVDVHRLIGSYWAWQLLAVSQGLEKTVESMPYGHYKAAWCLLVDRVNADTAQETWALLGGMETQCQALYAEAVKSGLSREACEEQAKRLVADHATMVAEQAKAKVVAAKAVVEQAKVVVQQEAAKCGEVAKARDEATDADTKARLEAELKAQQAKLSAAAVEESKATIAVSKAVDKVEVAETRAEKAVEKAEAATEKAAAKPGKGKDKPAVGTPEGRLENLLKTGKAATVKDAADMAASLITGHNQPDDVLELVLGLVNSHKDSSRTAKRACEMALAVLRKAGQTSPVAVNAVLEARSVVPMVQGEKMATAGPA